MSDVALFSVQEQQLLDAFQQAIDSKSFDRLILSQYKGELEHLEKITVRTILLQNDMVLNVLYRYKTQDEIGRAHV